MSRNSYILLPWLDDKYAPWLQLAVMCGISHQLFAFYWLLDLGMQLHWLDEVTFAIDAHFAVVRRPAM